MTYTMSSIFGITFLLGLFNIYRTFYSKEALIREAALKELRARRREERVAKQRRKREQQYLDGEEIGKQKLKKDLKGMDLYMEHLEN